MEFLLIIYCNFQLYVEISIISYFFLEDTDYGIFIAFSVN